MKKDKRIRSFRAEENLTVFGSTNLGVSKAIGKYFAIAESDDYNYPDRIQKQVAYMESHPDVDILSS